MGNYLNQDILKIYFMARVKSRDGLKPDIVIIVIALLGLLIIFAWVSIAMGIIHF